MRIIAGKFRGRKILPPARDVTRPITDRVKQSLFDILAPQIPGAVVYDCFAGTGSMGLECLSRDAESVTFFEADRDAVTRLRKNIAALDVGDRSRVVAADLFKWFKTTSDVPRSADLIFLDPPYRFLTERSDDLGKLTGQMAAYYLAKDGTLIFRHDAADELSLPGLERYDLRTYGGMAIELLRPQSSPNT
jgi:16S rRNA (guanine966-N2)-methyltransferase